ncbi:thiolase C-terminal domain-containing protein [Pseudomonas arsenicoxydans]|uniref:Acetyl-CoA acetyltransferase n=1 Tax=Pseudomonas arsenicoxydans TaxID=702115 RepID=A0A502GZH6_9PSED|nr:acetyl-CoA acetyltransferase [Pseudomonas arsenicoxydans]TPG67759.1 acetyl-CoA acetyltransferase [Pseudomonas arsenicoxydans]
MSERVLVAGAGMAPFLPLGGCDSHAALAGQAICAALADARIDYDLIDQVFTACVHGESGIAEQMLSQIGYSGVPVFSLADGCASASSAFQLARNSVLCGQAECVLVVGVECMPARISNREFFGLKELARDESPTVGQGDSANAFIERRRQPALLFAAQTSWLLTRLGVAENSFDQVLERARTQAGLNPYAVLNRVPDRDGWLPPYLSPPACGAAAVVICTPAFAQRFGARADVTVLASARGSDSTSEQESGCVLDVLGRATTRRVAQQAYQQAGLGAEDIDVAELHDQSVGDFMVNSVALGFCREDDIDRFVQLHGPLKGQKNAVNPSGGLLGRGHAPGASGLAQLVELVWQLRDMAKGRQIAGARTALQHSTALGRAVSITILQRT